MTTHSIDVPQEPDEGTVVLDRDGYAWQRSTISVDARWMSWRPSDKPHRTEPSTKPWGHLLTDLGPLTQLVKPSRESGSWQSRPPGPAAG